MEAVSLVPGVGRPRVRTQRGRPERWILLSALALLVAAPACQRRDASAPSLRVEMRVRPDPPVVGTAVIELDLRDVAGAPVRGAMVGLEGNMTHAGMASSLAQAKETAPGTYRAAIELTMAGDWVVLVDARLASGETVQHRLALSVARDR